MPRGKTSTHSKNGHLRAPYDAPKPGRPSKLEEHEREELFEQLQQPPTELDYEQQAWSTKLLLHHVKAEYGVEYSGGHARKLMGKAELSWRTARLRNHEADPQKEAEFTETVEKKLPKLSEKTVVVVDQFTKHDQARWDGATTWLVPNRLKSNDRDFEFMGQGDSAWRCHRRR